jgi:hypothetical protein
MLHFFLVLAPFFLGHELPTDTAPEPKRLLRFASPIALGGACIVVRYELGVIMPAPAPANIAARADIKFLVMVYLVSGESFRNSDAVPPSG